MDQTPLDINNSHAETPDDSPPASLLLSSARLFLPSSTTLPSQTVSILLSRVRLTPYSNFSSDCNCKYPSFLPLKLPQDQITRHASRLLQSHVLPRCQHTTSQMHPSTGLYRSNSRTFLLLQKNGVAGLRPRRCQACHRFEHTPPSPAPLHTVP